MKLELIDLVKSESDSRYAIDVFSEFYLGPEGRSVDPVNADGKGGRIDVFSSMAEAAFHFPRGGVPVYRCDTEAFDLMRQQAGIMGVYLDRKPLTYRGIFVEIVDG